MPDDAIEAVRQRLAEVSGSFERNNWWVVTRRLSRPDGQSLTEDNAGYLEVLPTFHGVSFVDAIRKRITDTGKASLLDIGCGSGLALVDLRQMFPQEQLRIVGVGHRADTERDLRDMPRNVPLQTGSAPLLRESGIDFTHANFLDKEAMNALGKFDFCTAAYSLNNLNYPYFAIFKRVWRQLNPNGIGFVSPFAINLINPKEATSGSLFRYLQESEGLDIDVNHDGVAFQKTQDLIPGKFTSSLNDVTTARLEP